MELQNSVLNRCQAFRQQQIIQKRSYERQLWPMLPLKSFIEREGSEGDRGLDARKRSMKRWRQWAKAMSIRWRGDFHGRRMLKKGQCNEQRGPKATLPELAKHWRISRSSSDRSGGPYTGVTCLQNLSETVSVRRGGDDDTRRLPTGTYSLLSNPPRGEAKSSSRRSSWRQGPEEWGSTKPMKVQEQRFSSGWATTRPQGAISESLSMGLGL